MRINIIIGLPQALASAQWRRDSLGGERRLERGCLSCVMCNLSFLGLQTCCFEMSSQRRRQLWLRRAAGTPATCADNNSTNVDQT